MGCGLSKRSEESIAVDKQRKLAAKEMAHSIKLLLLGMSFLGLSRPSSLVGPSLWFNQISGAGESGKSTFAKQMRILHVAGFSDEEQEQFKELIHENIIYSARGLIDAASRLNVSFNKRTEVTYIF